MADQYELGKSSLEVLGALIRRVINDANDTNERPDVEKVVDEVEKFIGIMPRLHRLGLLTFLRLFEVGPIALGFRHSFIHLSEKDQLKYLITLENHRNYAARGILQALKSVIIMIYFSDPAAAGAVGYDAACLLKAGTANTGS